MKLLGFCDCKSRWENLYVWISCWIWKKKRQRIHNNCQTTVSLVSNIQALKFWVVKKKLQHPSCAILPGNFLDEVRWPKPPARTVQEKHHSTPARAEQRLKSTCCLSLPVGCHFWRRLWKKKWGAIWQTRSDGSITNVSRLKMWAKSSL